MTVQRRAAPVGVVQCPARPNNASIELMSELQRERVESWLRFAARRARAGELVSPEGDAFCWLGCAARVASLDPCSGIAFVPERAEHDAHFTVHGAAMPDEHDEPLHAAMAAWYGTDLWEITVEAEELPSWLADELTAALLLAKQRFPKPWWVFNSARDGGGWPLYALSDLGVPTWLLGLVTREVLDLDPVAVAL